MQRFVEIISWNNWLCRAQCFEFWHKQPTIHLTSGLSRNVRKLLCYRRTDGRLPGRQFCCMAYICWLWAGIFQNRTNHMQPWNVLNICNWLLNSGFSYIPVKWKPMAYCMFQLTRGVHNDKVHISGKKRQPVSNSCIIRCMGVVTLRCSAMIIFMPGICVEALE